MHFVAGFYSSGMSQDNKAAIRLKTTFVAALPLV